MDVTIEELLRQGNYFLQTDRLSEGEKLFLQVLKYDNKHITALNNLGYIKYFLGQFQEGLDYCNRAIDISPHDAYSHKGKGLHLVKLGRLEEGIDFLKKSIDLSPDFIDPYYDLALTLYEHNRSEEARTYIIKGAKRCKDKHLRKLLGKLFDLVEEKINSEK
jgi:tetratricopeptide (TPR) repeat protein